MRKAEWQSWVNGRLARSKQPFLKRPMWIEDRLGHWAHIGGGFYWRYCDA